MPVSHMTSNDKLYLGKLMLLSSLVSKHNPMQHLSHGASLKICIDMHGHGQCTKCTTKHITSSTADRSGDWHTSRESVHGCILGKSTPKWLFLALTCYYSMRCLPPIALHRPTICPEWLELSSFTVSNEYQRNYPSHPDYRSPKQDRLFLYHCLREPPNGLDVLVLLKADHRVKLQKRKHMFTIAWTWSYYCLHAFASDIEQLIPPICLSIFWAKGFFQRGQKALYVHMYT